MATPTAGDVVKHVIVAGVVLKIDPPHHLADEGLLLPVYITLRI